MTSKRGDPSRIIRDLGNGDRPLTLADATRHIVVSGSTGAGKTSASGRALALSFLAGSSGPGAFVITKPDDEELWRKRAEEAGRGKEVGVFDASGEKEG